MRVNDIYVYNEKELEDAVVTLREISMREDDIEVHVNVPSSEMASLLIKSSLKDTREIGIKPTNNVKVFMYIRKKLNSNL